jgi:hypothetical protein
MIAGEGLIGILLAVFAVVGISDKINLTNYGINLGNIGGCIFFLILLVIMVLSIREKKKKK